MFLVIKSHWFPHFPTQGSMPEYVEYVMNSQFNGDFAGYYHIYIYISCYYYMITMKISHEKWFHFPGSETKSDCHRCFGFPPFPRHQERFKIQLHEEMYSSTLAKCHFWPERQLQALLGKRPVAGRVLERNLSGRLGAPKFGNWWVSTSNFTMVYDTHNLEL